MRNVVTGLMMLAGAAVREKGHGFDDFGWRREVQRASEAQEAETAVAGTATGDGRAPAGPAVFFADGASRDARMTVGGSNGDQPAPGAWDIACEREAGDRLVFDRDSIREMGDDTLFRWAPTGGVAPSGDDPIYTAVADCRGQSIEASWPGRRSETRAGTCGRHLVEAVCATRSAIKSPKPAEPDRLGRAKGSAPHASATP